MIEITVPEDAVPGDLIGLYLQYNPRYGHLDRMQFVVVPEGMVPGACFETRYKARAGDGWTEPKVLYRHLFPKPKSRPTADTLLAGFHNLEPIIGQRLSAWPLVVVRMPAPWPGESLHSGLCHRWRQCDTSPSTASRSVKCMVSIDGDCGC